jgi:hypothetical protein
MKLLFMFHERRKMIKDIWESFAINGILLLSIPFVFAGVCVYQVWTEFNLNRIQIDNDDSVDKLIVDLREIINGNC